MKLKIVSEGVHLAVVFFLLIMIVGFIFYFTPPVLSGN